MAKKASKYLMVECERIRWQPVAPPPDSSKCITYLWPGRRYHFPLPIKLSPLKVPHDLVMLPPKKSISPPELKASCLAWATDYHRIPYRDAESQYLPDLRKDANLARCFLSLTRLGVVLTSSSYMTANF